MKRYFLLTSVLALAACGGGSGGGGAGGISAGNGGGYIAPRAAVTSDVATSNSGITNMKSEIVVASNSTSPVLVRSAKSTSGDVTYRSYRLDDVKLYTAEGLDGNTYINLNLDENTGEINAVKMFMGGQDSGYIGRTIDGEGHFTNTFNGPIFEYVPDGDDRAIFRVADTGQTMDDLNALSANLPDGHWNRIDEQMVFETYGDDVGLQYSEFGYFNPVYKYKNKQLNETVLSAIRSGRAAVLALARTDGYDEMRTDEEFAAELAKQDYQLFAGGYAINGTAENLDKSLNPTNDTSYTGTAIGRVYVSIQSSHGDRTKALEHWKVPYDLDTDEEEGNDAYADATHAGHDMAKMYTTKHATLEVDSSGNRIIVLPFNTQAEGDKFYDIRIDQNSEGVVTGTKFTGDESKIADQYLEQGALGLDSEGNVDFEHNIKNSNVAVGFYGINNPDEASGSAYLQAKDVDYQVYDPGEEINNTFTREYEVQTAWGMKKD